ncbi:Lipopolysaccharide export system ATP-binding protein LptB [Xylophilus ampelinus]|nr:Lipopolysaccharide export system ATP-binding protein LptB [Xylophilus ampelinus]
MLPMPDQESLLSVRNIRKSFRGIRVLEEVSFDIGAGSITALVGSNGAGKSTLVNVLTGVLQPDGGEIELAAVDIGRMPGYARARAGLLRTFQHPRVFGSFTVAESIELSRTPGNKERFLSSLWSALRPVQPAVTFRPAHPVEARLAALADTPAALLSYGEKKLLMLSQVLAARGSVLCFDELCAGLEPPQVEEVRKCLLTLADQRKAVIFVEHNLALVRSLATRVIFLHQGRVFRDGPVDEVLADPEVVSLYLGE